MQETSFEIDSKFKIRGLQNIGAIQVLRNYIFLEIGPPPTRAGQEYFECT